LPAPSDTDLAGGDWGCCSTRSHVCSSATALTPSSTGHGEPTTLGRELERNPFLGELRAAARVSGRFQAPRGTHDVLPADQPIWFDTIVRTMEEVTASMATAASDAGVRGDAPSSSAPRAPAPTSSRGYTFTDRSDRSLTLRPEGTAPVCRAYSSTACSASRSP
jgi:hypothetical protein